MVVGWRVPTYGGHEPWPHHATSLEDFTRLSMVVLHAAPRPGAGPRHYSEAGGTAAYPGLGVVHLAQALVDGMPYERCLLGHKAQLQPLQRHTQPLEARHSGEHRRFSLSALLARRQVAAVVHVQQTPPVVKALSSLAHHICVFRWLDRCGLDEAEVLAEMLGLLVVDHAHQSHEWA